MRFAALSLLVALGACDCGEDGGGRRPSGTRADSGLDAATDFDSGKHPDASNFDLGVTDAGFIDFGLHDLGLVADAATDSGAFDADLDAGFIDFGLWPDATVLDAAAPDATHLDATVPDLGPPDLGTPDLGFPDSGAPGAGDLWIEIEYTNAFSPRSPTWRYSMSPGWPASAWTFTGSNSNGAEAWDRFNNMQVVNDPIGRVLEIGGSSELQLMFGLSGLISYTGATVELYGRSRATSSRVLFDVFNPINGCGNSGEMSQDWTPDLVLLDWSGCLVPGGMLQAVRVDPTSGTVALVRLRLTIHGAVW